MQEEQGGRRVRSRKRPPVTRACARSLVSRFANHYPASGYPLPAGEAHGQREAGNARASSALASFTWFRVREGEREWQQSCARGTQCVRSFVRNITSGDRSTASAATASFARLTSTHTHATRTLRRRTRESIFRERLASAYDDSFSRRLASLAPASAVAQGMYTYCLSSVPFRQRERHSCSPPPPPPVA